MTEPVQPWISPPPPPRPWLAHYGPAVGVMGLMLLMVTMAWKTLSTPDPTPVTQQQVARVAAPEPDVAKKNAGAPASSTPSKDEKDATAESSKKETIEGTETATKAEPPADEKKAPAGSVGLAKKPSGVLLRYNPEKRDWERLAAATPARARPAAQPGAVPQHAGTGDGRG